MADETLSLRSKQPHAPLPAPPTAKGTTDAAAAADPNDPMERARRRAAELREHTTFSDTGDKFGFDLSIIPPGWSYEWKRLTVMGAPDPAYQVNLAQRGWEAVPADRHPEMMPLGHVGGTIDRDGMRLMERPLTITEDAKAAEKKEARDLVRGREAQLTGGETAGAFARDNRGESINTIKKSYEQIDVPKN
jgi:hypothetical protein